VSSHTCVTTRTGTCAGSATRRQLIFLLRAVMTRVPGSSKRDFATEALHAL
jgi:hypothetical protein